jgi:hypothetical protein
VEKDVDTHDFLALNFTYSVQVCVDIGAAHLVSGTDPAQWTNFYVFADLAVRTKKTAEFRNIAVQNYDYRLGSCLFNYPSMLA